MIVKTDCETDGSFYSTSDNLLCRDTDKVTEWNKTLTEARVLKRINNDVAISYQVYSKLQYRDHGKFLIL